MEERRSEGKNWSVLLSVEDEREGEEEGKRAKRSCLIICLPLYSRSKGRAK